MRNYFTDLKLPALAARQQITDALELGSAAVKALNPKHRKDAYQILLEEDQRQLYGATVTLYEALHIAADRLQSNGGIDTHRWKERLAEFDTYDDDILNS